MAVHFQPPPATGRRSTFISFGRFVVSTKGPTLLFPVFPSAAIGRLLTDIAIGLGPSFIHDLKPKDGGVTVVD
jgi:hypothetical protein